MRANTISERTPPRHRSRRPSLVRRLVQVLLIAAVAAGAVLAGGTILQATGRQSVTTMFTMRSGGLTREYETIVPVAPLSKSAPIIFMLGGISEPTDKEIFRDRLVPYANAGLTELVYPIGFRESWNAGGCCGKAGTEKVDDIGYIKALTERLDPGRTHPLDVIGYSNGGRMAYRLACSSPGLFDQIAIVKADPMPGCHVTDPQTILQIAALDDYAVPYQPGDKGKETPPATVQAARLRAADRCKADDKVNSKPGKEVRLTVWDNCAAGTRVGFAVYSVGGHNFPPPTKTQPEAAKIIWAFFNHQNAVNPS